MSLDSDIALIKNVPLFAGLPTEQLRMLAFGAVRLELVAGQVLFRQGAKAPCGYVVSGGTVELSTDTGKGKEIVGTCETGVLIGEMALFIETRRPATATAITQSQVIEIERKLITRMLAEYPDIAAGLHAALAGRLMATVSDLGEVGQALAQTLRLDPRR